MTDSIKHHVYIFLKPELNAKYKDWCEQNNYLAYEGFTFLVEEFFKRDSEPFEDLFLDASMEHRLYIIESKLEDVEEAISDLTMDDEKLEGMIDDIEYRLSKLTTKTEALNSKSTATALTDKEG